MQDQYVSPSQEELRRLLGPVLNKDDTYNMRKLGSIAQRKKRHRWLTASENRVWDYLAANGGARVLCEAARQEHERVGEQIRQYGGTVVTTTRAMDGEMMKTVETFPSPPASAPVMLCTNPARARSRTARPRERRAGASSTSSGTDPGDGDGSSDLPPPASARLTLAPPQKAIYAFACPTAEQRADVSS